MISQGILFGIDAGGDHDGVAGQRAAALSKGVPRNDIGLAGDAPKLPLAAVALQATRENRGRPRRRVENRRRAECAGALPAHQELALQNDGTLDAEFARQRPRTTSPE